MIPEFPCLDLGVGRSCADRKPPNANPISCNRDHGPGLQLRTGHAQHALKDCRQRFTFETFNSDAHNGRPYGTRHCQQRVEIRIQRDGNRLPLTCGFQNVGIRCRRHAQLADVFDHNAHFGQVTNSTAGQTLIQQQFHGTARSSTTLSSRFAAAYSNAWRMSSSSSSGYSVRSSSRLG